MKSNEFLALVGSHRVVWTPRRDRELVQWLLLMSENGLISGDFLKLPVGDLPLRFEGAAPSPKVDKATDLLQMFHSIKGVQAREFALRFLALQVRATWVSFCICGGRGGGWVVGGGGGGGGVGGGRAVFVVWLTLCDGAPTCGNCPP